MDGVRNNIWLNYYSSVLCCAGVKCGLLCKNDDRPFLKNCPPTTLKGFDVTVTHLSFPNCVFFFFLWWTEYVLAALAAVLEWVKVKGFNTGVFR